MRVGARELRGGRRVAEDVGNGQRDGEVGEMDDGACTGQGTHVLTRKSVQKEILHTGRAYSVLQLHPRGDGVGPFIVLHMLYER